MLLKMQMAGWMESEALEGPPSMDLGMGSSPSTTEQWLKKHMVYFFSDQRLHAPYANF